MDPREGPTLFRRGVTGVYAFKGAHLRSLTHRGRGAAHKRGDRAL